MSFEIFDVIAEKYGKYYFSQKLRLLNMIFGKCIINIVDFMVWVFMT